MDKTLKLLARLLPGFVVQPVTQRTQRVESTRIDLPAAAGADYFYQIFGFCSEMQIGAQLIESGPEINYFWYRPFELAEFRNSAEALEASVCETLEKLLIHETRIVQKNGWLTWNFKCEYQAADRWNRIYGHSALKVPGWRLPRINGKIHVYQSKALVRTA
jgi:hypothetical protein